MRTTIFATALAAIVVAAMPGAEPARTADESLKLLAAGNRRYSTGRLRHPHQSANWRTQVAAGQHPFAAVLSCSDSRVPPEIVFDEGLGDLFVTRIAGHVADDAAIGSLEYAVEHLHVPVIVVLGHSDCGAVGAAIAGGEPHDHVRTLVDAIKPAVERARGMSGDLTAATVSAHVHLTAARLRASQPTLKKLVEEGKLRIAGAVYDLKTGKVNWLPE